MTKKRIAMFSVHTCPLAFQEGKETGGMNVYVMALSQELVKQGFAVDILTRSQSKTNPKIVVINPSLRVIHLVAGAEKSFSKKEVIHYLDEFSQSFLAFASKESLLYDLFHAHYYLSGMVCQILIHNKFPTTPLLMTFHTLALMKNLVARDELEHEEKERIDAEMALVKDADHIIAPSQTDSSYLQYLYDCNKEKITVIYPGVDTTVFAPMDKIQAKKHVEADLSQKLILFVGRIEPLKGIDMLLYALKILLSQNPNINVCLWIIGGDVSQKTHLWSKELQKLEKLRQLLHIITSVKFVGQQSQSELPYYYNAAEIVVIPSHYESFGIAALEAMSAGVPIITTDVAGITDLFDKEYQKLITSVNNPLLLASQMAFLLSNDQERIKIGQHVHERVQCLTWENVARKVSAVYRKYL